MFDIDSDGNERKRGRKARESNLYLSDHRFIECTEACYKQWSEKPSELDECSIANLATWQSILYTTIYRICVAIVASARKEWLKPQMQKSVWWQAYELF